MNHCVSRGLRRDCKTPIFAKVRLKLYRTPLLVTEQVPGSSSRHHSAALPGSAARMPQPRWSSLVLPCLLHVTHSTVNHFLQSFCLSFNNMSTSIETMKTETEANVDIYHCCVKHLHVAWTSPSCVQVTAWYIFLSP